MTSEVAVVIPVFDPGATLALTLESVFSQTQPPAETVVVDDESAEDLSWIEARFPSVRVIRQRRAGPSVARNRGILATSTSLIAFLDQDDLWLPEKLERQAEAMRREPRAGLSYCDVTPFIGDPPPFQPAEPSDPLIYLADSSLTPAAAVRRSMQHFADLFVVPSSVLLRREVIPTCGLLDPILPFTGDFDFLIRIGATYPVIHLPTPMVYYRRHEGNFSYDYDVGRAEVRALVSRYSAYGRWKGDRDLVNEAAAILTKPRALYAAQAFDCARFAFRRRDYGAVTYNLWRATLFSPLFLAKEARSLLVRRLKRTL